MKSHKSFGIRLRKLGAVATCSALVAFGVVSGDAGASVAHKTKKLSLANVTLNGGTTGDFGIEWIAQAGGFFKKNGLNVTFEITNGAGSAAIMATFLGGGYDFANNAAPTFFPAREAGAPIEAIFSNDQGQANSITISAAASAQFHIPTADSTPAQAIAQIKALKGTHISFLLSTSSSPGAIYSAAVFKEYGLSYGINCPTCDINESTTGSTTTQIAGFNAGKGQAFVNAPPNTIQGTNSTYINLGLIPPISQMAGIYVAATDSLVEQHPDTVQAMVDSLTEAWAYTKLHPVSAERMFASMQSSENGITSPDTIQALWAADSAFWKTPLMLRSAFITAEQVYNDTQTPRVTLTYNQWCAERFVVKAVATLNLGVKVPTSV